MNKMDFINAFSIQNLYCNRCMNEKFCYDGGKIMICVDNHNLGKIIQNKKGIPLYYVPKK